MAFVLGHVACRLDVVTGFHLQLLPKIEDDFVEQEDDGGLGLHGVTQSLGLVELIGNEFSAHFNTAFAQNGTNDFLLEVESCRS